MSASWQVLPDTTAVTHFIVSETNKLLHSLNAVAGSQTALPNTAGSASRFASSVFSRHAKPRGLDGFVSSMCIPVGRSCSTCHRFGFSHSFLKATRPPPPCPSRKKRTQANCQKYTDSNQNILRSKRVCLALNRGRRRYIKTMLRAASKHK